MENNEQAVIAAIRAHEGGLGEKLNEAAKNEIIYGRKNEPENAEPFDGQKFNKGFQQALDDHPMDWFLE